MESDLWDNGITLWFLWNICNDFVFNLKNHSVLEVVSLALQNKLSFFYAPKSEGRLCMLAIKKVGYQAKFNTVSADSCLLQKVIFN